MKNEEVQGLRQTRLGLLPGGSFGRLRNGGRRCDLDDLIAQSRLQVDGVLVDARQARVVDEIDFRTDELGHERRPGVLLNPGTGEVGCRGQRDLPFAREHDGQARDGGDVGRQQEEVWTEEVPGGGGALVRRGIVTSGRVSKFQALESTSR